VHQKIKIPLSKLEVKSMEDHRIKVRNINVQGVERTFAYYIPNNIKQNCPVVMACHGAYWNHEIMRRATGFDFEKLADEFGFIVVYPNSFGSYWFDGRISFNHPAKNMALDEGEFFKRIIEYTASVYGSDRENVFFSGFSNGGMLGFKMTSEEKPLFKGMALWCSHLSHENILNFTLKKSNTPMLLINCLDDSIVPFHGGILNSQGKSNGIVYSSYETFLRISEKASMPVGEDMGGYILYRSGKNKLIEVKGGGHTIPHPITSWPSILGKVAQFNSTKLVWEYFQDLMGK
jgi:polyhydroxybutyrate depolymerase